MSRTIRQQYDRQIDDLKRFAETEHMSVTALRLTLQNLLMKMRKDREVPHLTLCAFLQDHAAFIKEHLK